TASRVPSSVSGGRKARAMPRARLGAKLPLVTRPTGWSPSGPREAAGGGRGSPRDQAPQPAGDPPLALGGQGVVALEATLAPGHHPAQARLQRGDAGAQLVAGQRQDRHKAGPGAAGGRPAAGRSVSRPPSPAGVTPAPSTASHTSPAASAGMASSTPSSP